MEFKDKIKKLLKFIFYFFLVLILVIVVVMISNFVKTPSNDRIWSEESAILPDITISDSSVEVKNIRDWRYKNKETVSRNYYDDIFELDKIEKTWLLFNPFGKWEGIGHFFFVFEFENGKNISVSIEARRERDEKYASWKGVFNTYEIWYAYGSAADFMTRRVMLYDEDLYVYPLLISKKHSKALFLDLSKTAEKLENNPQFYNTITSNCTNLLAESANRVSPGSVPFHYSRIFTGFADNQLYDLGLIPNNKEFDQIFEEARVDQKIREAFSDLDNYSQELFWQKTVKYFNLK